MSEVLYAVEYLLRSLTWKHAVVAGVALVAVIIVIRLLKVKKDKIEEYVDKK